MKRILAVVLAMALAMSMSQSAPLHVLEAPPLWEMSREKCAVAAEHLGGCAAILTSHLLHPDHDASADRPEQLEYG